MATLIIGAAFAALAPVGYAATAFSIGSMLGSILFPSPPNKLEGPRINDLKIQSSAYGQTIPIVFGNVRIAGNVIWSSDIIESASTTSSSGGGKGGTSGGTTTTNYTYSVNSAIMICEGPVSSISRIWADGVLIYNTVGIGSTLPFNGAIRIYYGNETQTPDPTIEAFLGVGNAPAYRGKCYVVFSNLELTTFGNRLPSFTFEISEGTATPRLSVLENYDPLVPYVGNGGEHLAIVGMFLHNWIYDPNTDLLINSGLLRDVNTYDYSSGHIYSNNSVASWVSVKSDGKLSEYVPVHQELGEYQESVHSYPYNFAVAGTYYFGGLIYNPQTKEIYGITIEQYALVKIKMTNPPTTSANGYAQYHHKLVGDYSTLSAFIDGANGYLLYFSSRQVAINFGATDMYTLFSFPTFDSQTQGGFLILSLNGEELISQVITAPNFVGGGPNSIVCTGGPTGGFPYVMTSLAYKTGENIYFYSTLDSVSQKYTTRVSIAHLFPETQGLIYPNTGTWTPPSGVIYDSYKNICWFICYHNRYQYDYTTNRSSLAYKNSIIAYNTHTQTLVHFIPTNDIITDIDDTGGGYIQAFALDEVNGILWVGTQINSHNLFLKYPNTIGIEGRSTHTDYYGNYYSESGAVGYDVVTGIPKIVCFHNGSYRHIVGKNCLYIFSNSSYIYKFDYGSFVKKGVTLNSVVSKISNKCELTNAQIVLPTSVAPTNTTQTTSYNFEEGANNTKVNGLLGRWVYTNQDSHSGTKCLTHPFETAYSPNKFNYSEYTVFLEIPVILGATDGIFGFWFKFNPLASASLRVLFNVNNDRGYSLYTIYRYNESLKQTEDYAEGNSPVGAWSYLEFNVPRDVYSITFFCRGFKYERSVLIDDITYTVSVDITNEKFVEGFVIPTQTTGATALDQIKAAFFFDSVESDGTVKFVFKGTASAVNIPYKDLIVSNG